MPALKSDLKITIEMNKRRFSLNCVRGPWGRYHIKRGRSWSRKTPDATLTEIFEMCRKWAVKQPG